jgi:hypothetical protein
LPSKGQCPYSMISSEILYLAVEERPGDSKATDGDCNEYHHL